MATPSVMKNAPPSESLLGYCVRTGKVAENVASIISWIAKKEGFGWLACLNPHSYVLALKDPEFAAALRHADWLIPDGVGIVLASRSLSGKIRGRVTGSDIFWHVNQSLDKLKGHKVFFLGSTDSVLRSIEVQMARDFPHVQVAGVHSPPFKDAYSTAENDAILSRVNAANADVLWVAMTAPKQEKWLFANRQRLNVKFAAAVGAVFDFYTGRIRRSHPLFQEVGLEWLPRLVQEPRRLWRRMFVSAPVFAWHVLKHRVSSAARDAH